jgi:hypothetical protein
MITKIWINKDVTFCKCNCHSFTLYLPYAKLTSYSTWLMQISNDVKLIVADGAYKNLWGPNTQHPWGIRRTWSWTSPTWQCATSTTAPSDQLGSTSGDPERPHATSHGEWERMRHTMGLTTRNPDIKIWIHHTRISWWLTDQYFLRRQTAWRWTTGSAWWSPSLECCMLTFRMQLHKRTELSMYHFTESILQVLYLYFPKRGMISIMSKTNTGSNFNEYY